MSAGPASRTSGTSARPPGRRSIAFVIVLACCAAAPTVGDVGSCGGPIEALDAHKYFAARAELECRHCQDCKLETNACKVACDAHATLPTAFPEGCHPLVHDGDVCLNALDALGCGAFGDAVSDTAIVPTECDFCPPPVILEAGVTP